MEHLAETLEREAIKLGAPLRPEVLRFLLDYLALLERWNAKLNLVGPGTQLSWATRHVLDSLAPSRWIVAEPRVVDIGSGAGFPGIPLALLTPNTRFTLVEPRANRVAFLRNAVAALRLSNVEIRCAPASEVAERFPIVVGRAVAPPEAFAELSSQLAEPNGKIVIFTQREPPKSFGTALERVAWFEYKIGDEPLRAVGKYERFHVER